MTEKERKRIACEKAKAYRLRNLEKVKARERAFSRANKEKRNAASRDYYYKNREYKLEQQRQWKIANKESIRKKAKEYELRKRAEDPQYKLRQAIRNRLTRYIKKFKISLSAVRELGCTIAELKAHLESKFLPGMSWDNYGQKGWHCDHHLPLSSFNLADPEEFKKACHYTNLQPMWAKENIAKSNKQ